MWTLKIKGFDLPDLGRRLTGLIKRLTVLTGWMHLENKYKFSVVVISQCFFSISKAFSNYLFAWVICSIAESISSFTWFLNVIRRLTDKSIIYLYTVLSDILFNLTSKPFGCLDWFISLIPDESVHVRVLY